MSALEVCQIQMPLALGLRLQPMFARIPEVGGLHCSEMLSNLRLLYQESNLQPL